MIVGDKKGGPYMPKEKSKARLSIGSQTSAQRARNELKNKGIASKIVKIESRLKDGGCLFGIEVNEADVYTAQRLLHDMGIYSSPVL